MHSKQVYLPTDLHETGKERRLLASELPREAVSTAVRRQKLQSASRRYTADLAAEAGPPTPEERTRAVALAQRVAARTNRKAG